MRLFKHPLLAILIVSVVVVCTGYAQEVPAGLTFLKGYETWHKVTLVNPHTKQASQNFYDSANFDEVSQMVVLTPSGSYLGWYRVVARTTAIIRYRVEYFRMTKEGAEHVGSDEPIFSLKAARNNFLGIWN